MVRKSRRTPNTILGEVIWVWDLFWGTHLWLCQDALGMRGEPRNGFLDPSKNTVAELWEYFEESKTDDGRLAFDLLLDESSSTVLATIETTLPFEGYEKVLNDQMFLNLVADFVMHVRALPLINRYEGRGTEEQIDRAFQRGKEWIDAIISAVEEVTEQERLPESTEAEDDIPF